MSTTYTGFQLDRFVQESNRIEGINPPPHLREIEAHEHFLAQREIAVADLETFVKAVAGGKPLRRSPGQNVMVGGRLPPPGGPDIERDLDFLLRDIYNGDLSPYEAHVAYETLHPFMDGNGRSGRVLWAWHMLRDGRDPFGLGFLHRWYYDSLEASR